MQTRSVYSEVLIHYTRFYFSPKWICWDCGILTESSDTTMNVKLEIKGNVQSSVEVGLV